MRRLAVLVAAGVILVGCSNDSGVEGGRGAEGDQAASASTTDPDVPLEVLPIATPTQVNDPVVAYDAVWVGGLAPGETAPANPMVGSEDVRAWVVYRIDPESGKVTDTIPVPAGGSLVAAGEGAIWVTGAKGAVSRIDPASKQVTDEIPIGEQVYTLAVGAGAAWAGVGVSSGADRSIKRIDAAARTVTDSIPVTREGLVDVLAVGEDYLWVLIGGVPPLAGPRTDTLVRIDPKTRQEAGATDIPGGAASFMVPAKGGAWIVPADPSVGIVGLAYVDAAGKLGKPVELPLVPDEGIAGNINGLWGLADRPDGTLAAMVLDPATGEVRAVRTFSGVTSYSQFAVGPAALWLSTITDDTLGIARVGPT